MRQTTGNSSGSVEAEPKLASVQWHRLLAHALVFGLTLLGIKLGQLMTAPGEEIISGLIWPNTGIGLVCMVLGGVPYLVTYALGNLAGFFVEGMSFPFLFANAVSYIAGAWVGGNLIRRFMPTRYTMERIRDVFVFFLTGVVMSSLVSSLLSVASFLVFFSHITGGDFFHLFFPHWLADALGVLIFAPFFLVWSARAHIFWRNNQLVEVLIWLFALVVFGVSVFGNWAPTDTLGYPLELALFPLMAWGAVRFGQKGTVAGMVVLAIMAIWQLLKVFGDDQLSLSQSPVFMWAFIGVIGGTTLFLGAIIAEIKSREQEASDNETRLRAFIDAMPDIAFLVDEEGTVSEIFSSGRDLYAEFALQIQQRHITEIVPEETIQFIDKALHTGQVQTVEYPLVLKNQTWWFEGRISPLAGSAEELFDRKGLGSVIWVSYEITERKRNETILAKHDALLQASSTAKNTLLTLVDYEEALNQVLITIGQNLETGRIYIYENFRDRRTGNEHCECRFEWTDDGVKTYLTDEEESSIDYAVDLPGWYEILREQQMVSGRIKDFESPIPEWMEARGTYAIAIAPIIVDQTFWGFLGVDVLDKSWSWTPNELSVLELMAGSIGGFLKTKQNAEELQEAKVAADEANAAKSEFLAMMSHEIRTPMNAILGFADLMNQTGMQEDQREYLEIIQRSGKSLLELINNILDYSKIESRKIELEEAPFSLEQIICEVIEMVLVRAQEKGVQVDFEIIGHMPEMFSGDPHRMRQIFLNLVNNAVKFTKEGSVWIKAEAIPTGKPNEFQLHNRVIDTGIGISPSKIQKLFRPFTQVDSSTTRQFGGTGLGLVISKRLAERMGGKMWVESEKGKGSTFHFTAILEILEQEEIEETNSLTTGTSLDPEFAQHYPMNILLAEDEPVNQMIAEEILRQLGYKATIVGDGLKALGEVETGRYDVVLMDIHMPGIDGWEVTRRVRNGSAGEGLETQYIVALTAFALEEDKKKCLDAGMNDYLSKPIQIEYLKLALERAYLALNTEASEKN